jgi:hypothetical protein
MQAMPGLEMKAVGYGKQHLTAALSIPRYVDIRTQALNRYKRKPNALMVTCM